MNTVAVTVFTPGEIVWTAALAAFIVALVFCLVPATRTLARITAAASGTLVGWLAWNFTLHGTHARGFDTDAPVIALSWADAGSGIVTFLVVALIVGLWIDRSLPAYKVVAMAALAGITATIVDLFVL